MKTNLILIGVLLLTSIPLFSQSQYQVASQSTFTIAGTSTLHDWTMETLTAKGAAVFNIENGKLLGIENLKISVPTKSLKSGKDAMDKNAYQALKAKEYPTIQFDFTGVEQLQQEDGITQVVCKGKLTIAGTTQPEDLTVVCHAGGEGSLTCEGVKALKMSDFNVEAPTFMFGTIKTGDDIKVSFNISFNLDINNKINLIP